MRLSSGFPAEELAPQARAARGAVHDRLSLKRALDLLGAVGALIFFAPLMFAVYIALMLSGGSPIFAHQRVGRYGQIFPCFKFRSMVTDADQVLAAHLQSDPQ